MPNHLHMLSVVNKLPFHMPKVLLALVTSLILPIIMYQYWLRQQQMVMS